MSEATGGPIVVIDYGMGNVGSVRNMLRKVGADAVLSADPAVIAGAGRLILPGVGAFDTGMRHIAESGLTEVLNQKVVDEGVPVLGVCLGMQLLLEGSEEGELPGLGWVKGWCERFRADGEHAGLKVPHMGWNIVEPTTDDGLFDVGTESRFYFVHSYHAVLRDPADAMGMTTYGVRFPSAVRSGNVFGTQFHPEKSHTFGMRLFQRFLEVTA